MKNQRDYDRYNIPIHGTGIGCTKCDCRKIYVEVNDVSCTGLGIITNDNLARGDRLKLELMIPGDDIPMYIKGEVAWVARHKGKEGHFKAGLRFMEIHPCDKKRLMDFIKDNFLFL